MVNIFYPSSQKFYHFSQRLFLFSLLNKRFSLQTVRFSFQQKSFFNLIYLLHLFKLLLNVHSTQFVLFLLLSLTLQHTNKTNKDNKHHVLRMSLKTGVGKMGNVTFCLMINRKKNKQRTKWMTTETVGNIFCQLCLEPFHSVVFVYLLSRVIAFYCWKNNKLCFFSRKARYKSALFSLSFTYG